MERRSLGEDCSEQGQNETRQGWKAWQEQVIMFYLVNHARSSKS